MDWQRTENPAAKFYIPRTLALDEVLTDPRSS
jgi:hypothetical protein